MTRNIVRHPKSPQPLVGWQESKNAERWAASDTFDDRVSEDIFDADDERTEVGIIVDGMDQALS
jgi:hypothetical protein